MAMFAIHDGQTVLNVIVADNAEEARAVTDPSLQILEVEHDSIGIGWQKYGGGWRPASPYPSWEWDESQQLWVAPVPEPAPSKEFLYVWDEETVSWIAISRP